MSVRIFKKLDPIIMVTPFNDLDVLNVNVAVLNIYLLETY